MFEYQVALGVLYFLGAFLVVMLIDGGVLKVRNDSLSGVFLICLLWPLVSYLLFFRITGEAINGKQQ